MIRIENQTVRIILSLIFTSGFLLFIAPFFAGIVNFGNCIGTIVFGILSSYVLFYDKIMILCENRYIKIAVTVITVGIIIFFTAGAIISGFMIKAINNKPDSPDTVIVLGCRVKGTRPSLMLKRRLDAAYEYLSENEDIIVIVSGGKGDDEEISEAECMFRYLSEKGISTDRIFKEDKSSNTFENFKYSGEIMQKTGLGNRAAVVTDGYHQFRAALIAEDAGLETKAISAHTSLWLIPTYWIREWLATGVQLIRNLFV